MTTRKQPQAPSLLARFTGSDGSRRLHECLLRHTLIANHEPLAKAIAKHLTLEEHAPKTTLIRQGDTDSDILLLIAGAVTVHIKDRTDHVAQRTSGQHVGEMALIDPTQPRSATIITTTATVIGRLTEPHFTKLANTYPDMWRRLAIEIAKRLRQRNDRERQPNPTPVVFIGCSTEQLPIAEALQLGLQYTGATITPWHQDVFKPTSNALDDLLTAARRADFGVFLLHPDDQLISRKRKHSVPRDNVILELGLFLGALDANKQRIRLVTPRKKAAKLPSDLQGVAVIDYPDGPPESLAARLGPVVTQLKTMLTLGPR